MKDRDISELVERYEHMLRTEKSIYFDAEEFDILADYYEVNDLVDIAKNIVEQGLHIHPDNYSLMLRKAKYDVYDGLYTKALEYLNLHFSNYEFELYLLKIECLLQLHLYAEAYQLTIEVLSDDETDLDIILSELGFIYVEADYFDEAILYFEKSLTYKSDNIDVLSDLAYAYEMKDNFSLAIVTTNKILDIDPYSYEAWVNLGKLYSLQDKFEEAIDAFDFAITINEGDKNVLKMKAHCLLLADRTEEAISMFNECLIFDPSEENIYYSLAECYLSLEQYTNTLAVLDKCISVVGSSAKALAKKAFVYLQQNQINLAKEMIDMAFVMDMHAEEVNVVAGELAFYENRITDAEKYYLNAFELNNENETALDKLAQICISRDEFSKAVEYLEILLKVEATSFVKNRLALLYFELDNKDKFNSLLDSFHNDELKSLLMLFFSEDQFDFKTITRDELIARLNDARDCRQLFKNIKH